MKPIDSIIVPDEEAPILHYSLGSLLKPEQCVAIDTNSGFLALLLYSDERANMLKVVQFPPGECSVLLPLLAAYPYYCPYEVLAASFNERGGATDGAVARWRRRLQAAAEEGMWDQEMRPVRNHISRVRFKMRELGIDITSILETGYIFSELKKKIDKSAHYALH